MNIFTKLALSVLNHYGLEPIHPILHVKDSTKSDLLNPVTLKLPATKESISDLNTCVICADNGNITDVTDSTIHEEEGDHLIIQLKRLNVYV